MKCPSAKDWDLLAMNLFADEQADEMLAHARICHACRDQFQSARRQHTERVRMYEAFDRNHDELRDQLMAALPDEAPHPSRDGWVARGRRRLGGIAVSMTNSAGRKAAAIIVPAACILIVAAIFFTPGDNVAFAAVLERLRETKTLVCRLETFLDHAEAPISDGKMYMSIDHGSRVEMSAAGADFVMYSPLEGPATLVMPSLNRVMRMDRTFASEQDLQQQLPGEFVRHLCELTGDADRDLGRRVIEGRETQGFEISGRKLGLDFGEAHASPVDADQSGAAQSGSMVVTVPFAKPDDPAVEVPSISQSFARIWVDVETTLPVEMEIEIAHTMGTHVRVVQDQFEWDVPLDADLFTPAIPEGARELNVSIPPATEQTLLDGLRLYSDLLDGEYPVTLDPSAVAARTAMAVAAQIAAAGETVDPLSEELTQNVLIITQACAFNQTLMRDGREPEYFGEEVTPDDADQVLMRWNLEDGQVRVIYGDLSVETLPASD